MNTLDAMTVAAAANELGVSATAIYGWLADGTLARAKVRSGVVVLVTVKSVEKWKAERERRAK